MKKKRTLKEIEKQISGYLRENGRMPTYSEMMELLGVRSKSVVDFWVKKLIAGGILRKDANGFLIPLRPLCGLPLIGDIRAGFPSPTEEGFRDIISLDEFLVDHPDYSFILKVSGDSMINEGIKQGDLVVVEKDRRPKNGDIVIAEVDGEWTMKYFRLEGKDVVLEAANPDYPPIRARSDLRIGGVVSAVIRKYHL
jgi:repressor LexA